MSSAEEGPDRVRILGFVNHIAPGPDIEASIERAFEWGVDVIVAQGTGSDWGPHWLGSGEMPAADVAANVEPYVAAAVRHGVPFVFSFGIAGANVHLERNLAQFDTLCERRGWELRVGVIRSQLSQEYLTRAVQAGPPVLAAGEGPDLPSRLGAADVAAAERVVALVGPEPVMAALGGGVDGVLTGRALDIGLFMALPMVKGLPKAVAAHAGKLLECGGLAAEPGDSGQCLWAEVRADGFEVRSPSPSHAVSVRSLVSHTFYERSHPSLEENPGGILDLREATYSPTDLGVWCQGAEWIEKPYTVLMEGATRVGFRAISVLGVREPALLRQIRGWADSAEAEVRGAARFASAFAEGRVRMGVRIFGLDGVLGALEPNARVTGHEASVIVDVVADDRALAEQVAYFAFIRLFIGPYPDRKTTAGNAAAPFMPVVIPVSEVYRFGIYHLLPLEDPVEPFPFVVERFPGRAVEPSREERADAAV
ncbi:acyclic terpene utilization AtuA family protein [Prauserella flavalba]|uniref:acyclic terpene utilization AtuA family protein n=1 Tax=Prauserella flavalba TaxID=1477506 RepID=UPI0036E4D7EB